MTGGGSDGNFTAALGVPTLDGLGIDGDGAHTEWEHGLISSIEPRTRLMRGLLETLAVALPDLLSDQEQPERLTNQISVRR